MKGTTKSDSLQNFDEEPLNQTELQVLKLICKQCTSREIGEIMDIGLKSVERHREHLLTKTNSKNTAGLVVYAIKYKLFPDILL